MGDIDTAWPLLLGLDCPSGFLSGLLGIGGGIIIVPALVFGLPVIGIDWASGVLRHFSANAPGERRSGCAGYICPPAVAPISISGLLIAPTGARLMQMLPVLLVRRMRGVMSARDEALLQAGICAVVLVAHLAPGVFFAQLAGLKAYGLAWWLFIVGRSAPVCVGCCWAWFALSIAVSVARAIVR